MEWIKDSLIHLWDSDKMGFLERVPTNFRLTATEQLALKGEKKVKILSEYNLLTDLHK
jgi:hypothetical protein